MATGIDVRVGGILYSGIESYDVGEESTPVDVTDTSGAVGAFGIGIDSRKKAANNIAFKRMPRKIIQLEDAGRGTTKGIVRVPSSTNGVVSVNADLRPVLLAVDRTAQPYNGTVGGYFTYLLALVGITDDFAIDTSIASLPMVVPGWRGNVWYQAKKFFAQKGCEISEVSNNLVLRPLRGRITDDVKTVSLDWAVDDTELALSIEGYTYENEAITSKLVYPIGGWNEDVQVYQVAAREVLTFNVPLSASVSAVDQPSAQDFVGKDDISASIYSVMGADGLPLLAAQWTAAGGSVRVAIGEDTRSLDITITGADLDQYAPYRIAATAGPSDNYSSLRIVGTGIRFTKTLWTFPTAVSSEVASREVGATIDVETISTYAELLDAVIWTLARYGGVRQTIDVTATSVHRDGDSGSYAYPEFGDFDALNAAAGFTTVANLNTAYAGMTIADFNAAMFALVSSDYANQIFGNVAGSRRFHEYVWYRIRRAQISPARVTYVAEADTIVDDFDTAWGLNRALVVYNYFSQNPKSLDSPVGWSAFGTAALPVDVASGAYTFSGTSGQAIGALGMRQTYNIGTGPNDLEPNTTYYLSGEIRSYITPSTMVAPRLAVSGSGVPAPVAANFAAITWTRREIAFTTGPSGVVNIEVSNGAVTAVGTTVVAGRYFVLAHAAGSTYFDGDISALTSWKGTPNASRSELIPAGAKTIADFNAAWTDGSALTIGDANVAPLMLEQV